MDFLQLIQLFSQLGGKDAANSGSLPLPGASYVPSLEPGNLGQSSLQGSKKKGLLGMGGTDTGILQKGMNMFDQFNPKKPINIDPLAQKKNPLQGLMAMFGG